MKKIIVPICIILFVIVVMEGYTFALKDANQNENTNYASNENLLNIEISSIFQIKMIHIINTICIVNKKRKGDKNERTSNRRPYDYGYEQY